MGPSCVTFSSVLICKALLVCPPGILTANPAETQNGKRVCKSMSIAGISSIPPLPELVREAPPYQHLASATGAAVAVQVRFLPGSARARGAGHWGRWSARRTCPRGAGGAESG